MLSIKPQNRYAPSRWQYRITRFLLSRTYWFVTRIFLPIAVVGYILFSIWTSDNVRNYVADSRAAIFEKVAYFSLFRIEEIEIENATRLQEEEIRAALDVELPTSSLIVDREDLKEKMTSLDAIGEASIRFDYRGAMKVVLAPRIPAMIVIEGDSIMTVDKTGHRVEILSDRRDRAELFVIAGPSANEAVPEALKIIDLIKPISARVRGMVRVGERRWDIILTNGGRIKLPSEGAISAMRLILLQHKSNDVLNRDISVYDMRNPARPTLQLTPQAIEEKKRLENKATGESI